MKLRLMSSSLSSLLLLLWVGYQALVVVVHAAESGNSNRVSTMSYFDHDDVYVTWLQNSNYDNSILFNSTSSNNSVGLFWSMDMTTNMIRMAVVCPIGSGWCGFGLAEAGGMKGADMILYESQTNEIYDAYVLDDINGGPIRDECQNWLLLNSTATSSTSSTGTTTRSDTTGVMIFEVSRAFDTGDTFDRALIDDTDTSIPATRIIAAWGNTVTVSYHGQNRLTGAVRFYQTNGTDTMNLETIFQTTMNESADGMIELNAMNYTIPTNETTYAFFCWTYTDLVKLGLPDGADLHIIGFDTVIDDDTKPYVHHLVLYAASDPYTENITLPISSDICENTFLAIESVYAWAPGKQPEIYPSNVGTPLGGTNGFQSFRLEVHYNNPSGITNLIDSSGVRFYWTYKKRQYDAGLLSLGDPNLYLYGSPVGNGTSKHTFICSDKCSKASLTEPITITSVSLHMHKTGVRQTNEVIRNGVVVQTSAVDYYDFPQQGSFDARQGAFQLLPGDSFRTTCYYNGTDEVWGLGSQQEMCIGYIFYYPRQMVNLSGYMIPFYCAIGYDDFPECNATYEAELLTGTEKKLNRTFGSSNGSYVCPHVNNNNNSGNQNNSTPDGSSTNQTISSAFPLLFIAASRCWMVALCMIVSVLSI